MGHAGVGGSRFGALSLRTQLLLVLALLGALPVVLLGVVEARVAEENEAARADRETLLASTSLARELGRIIEGQANVARALATEVGVLGAVDARNVGGKTERYLDAFPGLYGVFVLDARGVTIEGTVSVDGAKRSTAGTTYVDRTWFHHILAGAPFASELLRSRTTNRPGVILIAPIRDGAGTFLGLVGAGIDLDAVQGAVERVTEAAPGLASVVADESGRVVAASRNGTLSALDSLGGRPLYRPVAGLAPEPRAGDNEGGEARRGVAARVESTVVDWSVTTSWPQSAIRQRSLRALSATGAFALGAFGVALAVALLLARTLARPVVRLSARLAAAGGGDLRAGGARPAPWSPREILELGSAIDRMLEQLKSVVVQLGRTVVAVRAVTQRLGDASGQMVGDSRAQEQAVQRSSRAIVQITDAIGNVGGSVHGLSDTASETSSSIGSLNRQIEQIAESLGTLAGSIQSALRQVQQMQQQVAAVAADTERLGGSVDNTGESLRQLTQSIRGVAERAERGRGLARDALSAAQAGQSAVEETIEATQEIQRSFSAMGQAVQTLASRSEAIGGVASIIDEVMGATRLVGINASIIASEAGEHGKRFGVVAERVRAMAAETALAIDKITRLVAAVQSDVAQVVDAVRSGQRIVQAGERWSAEAGVRLRAIIESSEHAERTTKEIAEAMRDQAGRVSAVQTALDDVRQATARIEKSVDAQREAQKQMGVAIDQVRSVGEEVRQSTRAQQAQSEAMTSGVRAMTSRLREIAHSIESQNQDRERIETSLEVFEGASRASVERARQIGEVVGVLNDRLEQLERELGAFRVE